MPLSNPDASFASQIVGALVIIAWVFAASFVVWSILKATMGIRVSEEEELSGIDLAECGLQAYPEFVSAEMPTSPVPPGSNAGDRISRTPSVAMPAEG